MTPPHRPYRPELSPPPPDDERCPVCGSEQLYELRCKVICRNCRTVLRSCADL